MKINFEYSYIFDLEISERSGLKINDDAVNLVESFILKYKPIWNQEGLLLLTEAKKISGFDFKQQEMKCLFTLSDFCSMSHPLVVNIKKYINADEISNLSEIVFHELLHVLLTDNWKVWPTPLIKEFSGNNRIIAAHLHLMSVQLAVHKSLSNNEQLSKITEDYDRIGRGYDECWKIVNENDRYLQFIDELQDKSLWSLRV